MPAARRPLDTAGRPSLRRDREPLLVPRAPAPPARLPGPDYWLREETLVEPPVRRRRLPDDGSGGEAPDPARRVATEGHRGLRWLLWLVVLLLVPALAAWALSRPGPWPRLDAVMAARPGPEAAIPATLPATATPAVAEPVARLAGPRWR